MTNSELVLEAMEDSYPKPKTVVRGSEKLDYVSPSRIVRCLRGSYFESHGILEPITPKLESIFGYGEMRHNVIQDYLTDKGVIRVNPVPEPDRHVAEFRFEMDSPKLFGFADGIFSDEESLLEIKTISRLPKAPLQSHIWQAHLYMHMSEIDETVLLYESKDSLKWRTFSVPFDQEIYETVRSRAFYLLKCFERGKIPKPEGEYCPRFCKNPGCFSERLQREVREKRKGRNVEDD